MNFIKDTREEAGLSQRAMGRLLGVSKSMIFLMEKGKRHLSKDNILKIVAIQEHLRQNPEAEKMTGTDRVVFTDPARMGEQHQQKMETHLKLAESFKKQLEKLQETIPALKKHGALRELIKNLDVPGYRINRGEQILLDLMELESKSPSSLQVEMEELQDKIDTHLAYANLHQQRWKIFEEMNIEEGTKGVVSDLPTG